MNVLLATANQRTAERIRRALEKQRHVVVAPTHPDEALAVAGLGGFDLLLLDAAIEPSGGAIICRRLREAEVETPIIVVSATGNPSEAAQTIDAGADDVVAPSVPLPELLARVRALQRRDVAAGGGDLEAGDLKLDISRHAALRGAELINLTAKEFQLLEYLLRRQGQVVRREDIRRALWPEARDDGSNVVDIYVHYLRDKIERPGEADLIRTVRGVGYMLKA